jgi:hypothetical protein
MREYIEGASIVVIGTLAAAIVLSNLSTLPVVCGIIFFYILGYAVSNYVRVFPRKQSQDTQYDYVKYGSICPKCEQLRYVGQQTENL